MRLQRLYTSSRPKGISYIPVQTSSSPEEDDDALDKTLGCIDSGINWVDRSSLGQMAPVKKKTNIFKQLTQSIQGYRKYKKKKKKENH